MLDVTVDDLEDEKERKELEVASSSLASELVSLAIDVYSENCRLGSHICNEETKPIFTSSEGEYLYPPSLKTRFPKPTQPFKHNFFHARPYLQPAKRPRDLKPATLGFFALMLRIQPTIPLSIELLYCFIVIIV